MEDLKDSNLISGADAKLAWANGENVQFKPKPRVYSWADITNKLALGVFDDEDNIFRLKPNTIKIEMEIPVSLSDAEQMEGKVYYLNDGFPDGYALMELDPNDTPFTMGAWRTEEEIKQVVEQLRKIKGAV